MRILYGVTGDGYGHTMRARTLAAHLTRRGHAVMIATSGKSVDVFARSFPNVVAVCGMRTAYEEGRVRNARTVKDLFAGAPHAIRHNTRAGMRAMSEFDPELVVTDFDSFSRSLGRIMGRPVISIDHQHVLDRFEHAACVRAQLSPMFRVAAQIVRAKTPNCRHYVVSSFFFPHARASKALETTLVGPILRPEILAARATAVAGEHVLVYQTAAGDPRLLPALHAQPKTRFVVYGTGHAGGEDRNVTFVEFDEARFIRDLASARAVIANGGFTTLSEAVALGKPVFSVPIQGQPEQELNAAYVEALGLGTYARAIDAATLERFLTRVGHFHHASDPRLFTGTSDACGALDRAVDEAKRSAA
jgi:uncharacterized protein (TIGR00661 family)